MSRRHKKRGGPYALQTVVDHHIKLMIDANDGNVSKAAQVLEINRRSIQRWLKRQRKKAKGRKARLVKRAVARWK